MIKKLTIYIFSIQIKYISYFLILLLTLIWVSQILRLMDFRFSIGPQLYGLLSTTILVLPSFINPLLPIILLVAYIYINFLLTSSGQNLILNQYIDEKEKKLIQLIIKILFIIIFYFNFEIISPKFYRDYKVKELELRNNLKLGLPSNNEFHIGEEISIFFQSKEKNQFKNIESIIYKDNQFIKSDYANVEYDNTGFNIIFRDGIRIKMKNLEKSKTIFKKFTYHISKNNLFKLSFDKEHFNTIELLKSNQKDFIYEGHKRIIIYLIFLSVLITSNKIIFKKNLKEINKNKVFIVFFGLIFIFLINSYSIYSLNKNSINILSYYMVNLLSISTFIFYCLKSYDN